MASPEPDRMIAFASFHGVIWETSVQTLSASCTPTGEFVLEVGDEYALSHVRLVSDFEGEG